jgi:outer membrane immunogenic protein
MSGDFFRTGAFNFAYDVHSLRTGWTAGGGIEYAFAGPWTAKFEGLVYDLGKSSPLVGPTLVTGPLVAGFARGNTFNWQGAIVRVGVNYKFAQ